MKPYFSDIFGNSESVHSFGRDAQKAVDEARESVAKAMGAGFREIIFTASATEANNMALRGVVGRPLDKLGVKKNIIISSIEHGSVHKTAGALQKNGIEVRFARPDGNGVVSPESVKKLIDEDTLLVSVMHGNNEIGTIQPIAEIGCKIKEERLMTKDKMFPLFHTDAAQSFAYIGLKPHECGVDLATMSGHKMYGPKGVGALFVREGVQLNPIITGGEHERGFRAGTLNIPSIVGFAEAVKEAEKSRNSRIKKITALKKYFWESLKKNEKSAEMNGDMTRTLPHILNIHFPRIRAEELVVALDMRGIAVSSGSACASRAQTSSRTVRETYKSEERARRSVRFSFGEGTAISDLLYAVSVIGGLKNG